MDFNNTVTQDEISGYIARDFVRHDDEFWVMYIHVVSGGITSR